MASIAPTKFTWHTDSNGRRSKKPARDTRWRARWRDPNGRTRSKNFDRKIDAQRFLERVGNSMQTGAYVEPALQRTKFDAWASEWFQSVDVAPTTRRGYDQALDRIWPTFSGMKTGSIDRPTVRRFVTELRRAGYAQKTVKNTLSVLKGILDLAVEARALPENPATRMRLGAQRRHDPLFLTPDQVHALVDAAAPAYQTLIQCAAYTGGRPAELAGLRIGRLDLLRGTVTFAETLTTLEGKLVEGPTKTYETRTVPLPTFLREELAEYLAERRQRLGRDLGPGELVFVSSKGYPIRTDKLLRWVKAAAEHAGLPRSLRTYDLRHTYASLLIAAGAHPKVVQERLGHKTITMTLDVYGHLFPALDEQITGRLEELHRGAAQPAPSEVARLSTRDHPRIRAT